MRTACSAVLLALVLLAGYAFPAQAGGVVSVCDEPHLLAALTGGGVVTFACSGTLLLTNEVAIAVDTTLDGSGQAVTISGQDTVRVFRVLSGATFNLNRVTVAHGTAEHGGAVLNEGTARLSECVLASHRATSGGAIYNDGAAAVLAVHHCTFSGNYADGFQGAGGGVFNDDGVIAVASSTFVGNHADQQGLGGAIYNRGTLMLSNSTFFGNSATYGAGGAIFTGSYGGYGTLTATNCTIAGNNALSAGGIYVGDGKAMLSNTIVANNRPGGNCRGNPIADGGGNLSWPGMACPGVNADPLLGPLQDNGGSTWTMAPGPGSAAIDAGIDALCAAAPVNGLDQRGVFRPQGSRCDIGAVEQQPYRWLWFPAARAR